MFIETLKLAEPLPLQLTTDLEKNGELMVHEYYATKADKVIQRNRKNRALKRHERSPLQQSDMAWARDLVNKRLAMAEALVREHIVKQQQNTTGEQHALAPNRAQSRTPHRPTLLVQPTACTTQAPHAGRSEGSPRPPECNVPVTEIGGGVEVQRKGDSRSPRHITLTVEMATDSGEDNSWSGAKYVCSDSADRAAPVGSCDRLPATSTWKDEWAINEQGIYYS